MPSYHEIIRPERPRGTEAERWEQVYRYLWKLSEQIEDIINSMTEKEGENHAEAEAR